jgi:hypothetical protein
MMHAGGTASKVVIYAKCVSLTDAQHNNNNNNNLYCHIYEQDGSSGKTSSLYLGGACSNLSQDTSYPQWGFSSVHPGK